jgi:hypothetical protein
MAEAIEQDLAEFKIANPDWASVQWKANWVLQARQGGNYCAVLNI